MKKLQKGFTLIELMIVIAIIGILAAIAMPAYQDYIARTQASEGFKATSGLQSDIAVYAADQNKWPFGQTSAGPAKEAQDDIQKAAGQLQGKYFGASGFGGGTAACQGGASACGVSFAGGFGDTDTLDGSGSTTNPNGAAFRMLITFDAGANKEKVMVLYPVLSDSKTQIAKWRCEGADTAGTATTNGATILKKRLPGSCQ